MLRIKFERQKRGWSQQVLGFCASVAAPDISKIEQGWLIPYPSQAHRLAQVLEISPQDLLQEMGSPDEGNIAHTI